MKCSVQVASALYLLSTFFILNTALKIQGYDMMIKLSGANISTMLREEAVVNCSVLSLQERLEYGRVLTVKVVHSE